ncbi:hypothetical protein AX15_005340 [Amanita polypyramis BW_CC]|nr:hypothetical protein AX15_005340 [Amanita polypyramis BW_CC]
MEDENKGFSFHFGENTNFTGATNITFGTSQTTTDNCCNTTYNIHSATYHGPVTYSGSVPRGVRAANIGSNNSVISGGSGGAKMDRTPSQDTNSTVDESSSEAMCIDKMQPNDGDNDNKVIGGGAKSNASFLDDSRNIQIDRTEINNVGGNLTNQTYNFYGYRNSDIDTDSCNYIGDLIYRKAAGGSGFPVSSTHKD